MKAVFTVTRMLLLFAPFGLGFCRVDAQTVRALDKINSQAELDKALPTLDAALFVHRFHHPGNVDKEGVGEAQFIHLWQYQDGARKITRVISYDHHTAAK